MFIMINETARANINNILERAIDIGQRMLVTGAEVSRVERTITFICRAYGVRHVDVMVITSSIIVTIRGNDIGVMTQMRRVPGQNFDFQRLKSLNQLSREICAHPMTSDEIKERTYDLKSKGQGRMIQVSIPASVPLKEFDYNAKVEIINPVADTVATATFRGADVDWYIKADDIVLTKDSSTFKNQPQPKKEPATDK